MVFRKFLSKFANFDSIVFTTLLLSCTLTLRSAYDDGHYPLSNSVDSGQKSYSFDAYLTPSVLSTLESKGFVVIDNVLSKEELDSVEIDIATWLASSGDTNGGKSADGSKLIDSPNRDSTVRTDKIGFLLKADRDEVINRRVSSNPQRHHQNDNDKSSIIDRSASGEALLHSQNILLGLGSSLLNKGFSGFKTPFVTKSKWGGKDVVEERDVIDKLFVPDQVMLSLYSPSGAFYKKHLDAVTNSMFYSLGLLEWLRCYCYRVRVITAILYLNNGNTWNGDANKDGGCLRIYFNNANHKSKSDNNSSDDDNSREYVDVSPAGGKLVIFDSQTIYHEVLSSNRKRHAISIWLTSAKS